MATLGFADLKDTALPSLWDTSTIVKAQLADGSTVGELLADLRGGLRILNGQLLDMPHYGNLFAVQDEPTVEYPIGVSNGFTEATEYTPPDPKRGATTGHMLPLTAWDRGLGWTMMYLQDARREKLNADVASALADGKSLFQKRLLTRFFTSTGNTVGSTSNADVPFADGGSVDSSYVPPDSPEGETFLYTHSHFLGYGTSGITQDTINQSAVDVALEHLQEHGHESPFEIIGSRTDASSWTAVTNWKAPEWPGVVYHASGVERAAVGEISSYFGYVESDYGIARVWLTPRLPTLHFGVYKAYPQSDARNPLRVRINRRQGFGFVDVPGVYVNAPSQMIVLYARFGVGVGDRVNGVGVDVAASTYSSPTIS